MAPADLKQGDFGAHPRFQVAISATKQPEIAGEPRAQPGSGNSGRCKRLSTVQGRWVKPAAMAAGLTQRIWSVGELLRTPLILPET